MANAGLPYEVVFEEARQLGYLEADPNLDVGGIDAGHKLSLLASIAFGTKVAFDHVELEGIGNVSIEDINLADDMGYHIKLLGVAQMSGRGLEQRMTPRAQAKARPPALSWPMCWISRAACACQPSGARPPRSPRLCLRNRQRLRPITCA